MEYVIYRIQVKISESESYYYIGKTTNYNSRKAQHSRELKQQRHHCRPLQALFNKFGVDNAEWTMKRLEEASSRQQLKELEDAYINYYKAAYKIRCVNTALPKAYVTANENRYARMNYTFYNAELRVTEYCSKSELAAKYNLSKGNVTEHVKGSSKYSHIGGWVTLAY